VEPLNVRLKTLETKLTTEGEVLGNHADLPFAIFWYPPGDEWTMRGEIRRLAVRVQNKTGKEVVPVSLAELLWQAIEETVGIDDLAEAERASGFQHAQDTVNALITDRRFRPLPDMLAARMEGLSPERHIAFLTRAAAFAPLIYTMSALLEQIKLHRILVPTVLFYPGSKEGVTSLRYMDLRIKEALGNYFVPIY